MSVSLKLTLSALALEAAALTGALYGESSATVLATTLLMHAASALLLAFPLLALLPARLQQPRPPILLLFTAIGFCLPLLGSAGILLAVIFLRQHFEIDNSATYHAIHLPEIDPHQRAGAGFRQAGLGAFLANTRAPEATRMRALVSLQNVPGRVASPLLRNVLSDPSEDIRLLAYGMLDNQEKHLNDQIHDERQRLNGTEHNAANRRLADLYWELVYRNLVQGDLRTHALMQSLSHSEETLRVTPNDSGLYLHLGRLRQMLNEPLAARAAYEKALSLGMPRTRITPYLAELAFDQRDFATTRAAMRELEEWRSLPRLRPIIEFWSSK